MKQIQKHYGTTESVDMLSSSTGTSTTSPEETSLTTTTAPSFQYTSFMAICYVLSGVTQPLIMTLAKEAGIADPSCQIYMVPYYFGPALVTLAGPTWPKSTTMTAKAASIAFFDLFAQAMNYTGSMYAGPTIFAIIYSSVTVWTAVFSRVLLRRKKSVWQWLGVAVVFFGLCITGLNSIHLGPKVFHGALLVFVGSCMHALVYVVNEAIMTRGSNEDKVTVQANCAIQGIVACSSLTIWQIMYTRTHFEELVQEPVQAAGSTWFQVGMILCALALSNLIHAFTYFHTLAHFPSGATSAGIMKGLQAVLVFLFTSVAYCGRLGGQEMCFSKLKLASLIVVVFGVVVFGKATTEQQRQAKKRIVSTEDDNAVAATTTTTTTNKDGYVVVVEHDEEKTLLQKQQQDQDEQV